MAEKHLTPAMVARTIHVIDSSDIVDLICPPREPGQVGRIGSLRENTRLLLIGMHLCARLGQETTLVGVHQTLTQALSRTMQWELGVLRPLTSKRLNVSTFDPDAARLTSRGKRRKRRWPDRGVEEIGYDDLCYAMKALRERLDYGPGSARELPEEVRAARRLTVALIVDRLIAVTTIPRLGDTWAVDATGFWVWSKGHKGKAKAQAGADPALGDSCEPPLEAGEIGVDDDGNTAPEDQDRAEPAGTKGRCLDAAWGYRTAKDGQRDVAFGFHLHALPRVPGANEPNDSEPLLIDGFELVPANADVVGVTLDIIDRIRQRHTFKRVIGDGLYTHLRAERWAIPLADRGIEQVLTMHSSHHGVIDVQGAQLQHGWAHCAAAPMQNRPLEPARLDDDGWEEFIERSEDFRKQWACDRKESGLGPKRTSKWMCPASAGRAGCHARGAVSVQVAIERGTPVITPPDDWRTRQCCTQRTFDFTPDPTDPQHQRKLAQREYYGSRRWRQWTKRRSYVEGVFGILKNSSRLRLRRGQNRIAGLAASMIVTAIKISLYNEEALRAWDEDTGRGPTDHPLLTPDPAYPGFVHLTEEQALAIDAEALGRLQRLEAA